MKFPMLVPCGKCGEKMTVETTGNQGYPDAHCDKCGTVTWVVDSSMRVGHRVFCRAEIEQTNGDFSFAIILSAMSVESELAYQYSKWKMLDADILGSELTSSQKATWENEFQKHFAIGSKLDAVAKLLTGMTFAAFIKNKPTLLSAVHDAHPNIGTRSPRSFFEEELFRKRNKILHSGEVGFGQTEGETCVRMAMTLHQIINEEDKDKYARRWP